MQWNDLYNSVNYLEQRLKIFFNSLLSAIKNLGLSITMCYGQSYDGASTMSGEISGLQTKIREVAPNALFTHCCAHNLNLILMDAVSSNLKTKLFFWNPRNCLHFFLVVYHVFQY